MHEKNDSNLDASGLCIGLAVSRYHAEITESLRRAAVAVGLLSYGASLNDVLDARHDSAFSPERPIPAGRIRYGQAIVVTVGALIVAMLGGLMLSLGNLGAREPSMGAVGMTLLTATSILFYNAAGKYIRWFPDYPCLDVGTDLNMLRSRLGNAVNIGTVNDCRYDAPYQVTRCTVA